MERQEEVIKEAWRECYDEVKPYIDKNGWLKITDKKDNNISDNLLKLLLDVTESPRRIRPKSLQGIENNNGWTKILSEADLPIEDIDCFYIIEIPSHYSNAGRKINIGCFKFNKNIVSGQEKYFTVDNFFFHRYPFVTHYAPIEKKQPPIF